MNEKILEMNGKQQTKHCLYDRIIIYEIYAVFSLFRRSLISKFPLSIGQLRHPVLHQGHRQGHLQDLIGQGHQRSSGAGQGQLHQCSQAAQFL